jgi:hypothetical protein
MVTWNGCGRPEASSARTSPSSTKSSAGRAAASSTTSGTASVTSRRARVNTRTRSPPRWTWTRTPSSFCSHRAAPSRCTASPTDSAVSANIGATGRNSSSPNAASPASPCSNAATQGATRSPLNIVARRTAAAGTPAARATASASRPASAPCRSSPVSSAPRKACSPAVARANSARSCSVRAVAEPLPLERAQRRERRVDLVDPQRRLHHRGHRTQAVHRGVPDADPPLAQLTGQPRDDDRHRGALQHLRQLGDLRGARAGRGHARAGGHELGEGHAGHQMWMTGAFLRRCRTGSRDSHTNSSGSSIAVRNPPLPHPVSIAITCSAPAHRFVGVSRGCKYDSSGGSRRRHRVADDRPSCRGTRLKNSIVRDHNITAGSRPPTGAGTGGRPGGQAGVHVDRVDRPRSQ